MITYNLSGRTALVTGSNRGIGKAMADALETAGAKVVRTSSKECDLSDRNAVYAFIERIKKDYQIDILVNNAGMILRKPAAEHPDDWWDKVIDVNLNAQFILAREFGRDMVERGWGKIVFTCSLLSFQGGITVPGYAASKGGVAQLVKALSNEWAPKGVNVNGIAPGYIATDNTAALRADPVRSRQILERIPAGRWGEASDIAGACVFLCSPAADYVNGVVLPVDGGWLAR
ncbi:MAG: SDR family oxidoreductase [Kiritimatiellae bacterium]|nr:SDR family oxidoreductase [Kiritimatiellia bacterium]